MKTAVETEPDVTTLETGGDDGTTDADLIAGYEGKPAPVETPPAADPAATTDDPALEPTPEHVVEEEPEFVQITKAQLTEFQSASQGLHELRDALHRNVSGMGSKMGTLEAALKTIQEKTPAGQRVKVTKEHFKELGEQFPDLLDMTVTGLNRALEDVQGTAPVDVDAKVNERLKAEIPNIVTTVKQQTAIETMDELIPGWLQTAQSPEYRAWLAMQPKDYADTINNSWKPSEVKGAIEKFDAFTNAKAKPPVTTPTPSTTPTRPSRAAAAVTPRSAGAGGRGSVATEDSEMQAEYNKGR